MASYRDLGIPASNATVDVKVFNISPSTISASRFMRPVLPGREHFHPPMFSFLIDHPASKHRIMFDIAARKDIENCPPSLKSLLLDSGLFDIRIEKDIIDHLEAGNIPLASINQVIWSHAHFDHVGDMSKFPTSTDLVVGQDTKIDIYSPDNPNGSLCENYFSGRNVVKIDFDESQLSIGNFRAIDYFKDGALYLLDIPGHMPGHMAALARVTPTSFLLLGGDTCHHPAMLRPTAALHRSIPCPEELLLGSRHTVSTLHFPPDDTAGGNTNEFDLKSRNEPFLEVPDQGVYVDPPTARVSLSKLSKFDANPDVFIMIAHDESLVGLVELFPDSLNEWKAKGWKTPATWAFVDVRNDAFRLAPVGSCT